MPPMGADEYRAAIAALGLSQVGAARFFGVAERTGRLWAANGPPAPAALMLRYMLARRLAPATVMRVIAGANRGD